jgi:transcriptional regulator with XRE-family HTH domain
MQDLCGTKSLVMDPATFYAEVGRRIRALRAARGISQEELAAALSLSRTSVTNIERGRQRILLHILLEVCGILGADPMELLPPLDSTTSSDAEELLPGDLPEREREWIAEVAATVRRG